ncbi:hypothetical protein DKK70_09655 [Gilliamella apicola]|uniref:Uncharacterized protein n=2 Tax=Orbaceae TaxID=1240483 RepID=A0A318MYR8_FRIPE|nr:hypothetical protein DKK76_02665 [Frischella perrara]PXZ06930.1 hypothetical protein DKK70_09635 [Gilliamella apicola]PXY96718.1 hypothetical protein DKK76_02635 [Frischella perrara]PXZ06931.1 hypothetical protein DKK70_09640 [Gilliamella apicola]PXZ06932.1 hypothetical protein DKK70_09645 [Gilliamella apicola]
MGINGTGRYFRATRAVVTGYHGE